MAVQTDCCSCAVTCYSENLVVPWGSRPHPPCSLALWHQNLRCFHKHFEEVIDTSSTAGVILTPDPHSAARFLLRVWFFFFFSSFSSSCLSFHLLIFFSSHGTETSFLILNVSYILVFLSPIQVPTGSTLLSF